MKNKEAWRPSKFVFRDGKLMASRDLREVGYSSRLMGDRVAACYEPALRDYARGRLLDLGCGKVPFYEAYRDHVPENICVDWAEGPHGNSYLDLEHDLTKDLPFAEGEFDTILLSDVLEHLPEPARLWAEMHRVLVPGGRVLMNVPFYYWIHEHPHDFYRYTEFALRRFAEEAGFRVMVLKPIGGLPEIMADTFAKNIDNVRGGWRLGLLAQKIATVFTRTKLGRRISESTAKDCPLGYFMVAEKKNESGEQQNDK